MLMYSPPPGLHPHLFCLCFSPGTFCGNLWERRGGGEPAVSGELQEVAAGGDDAGDRGGGGLAHRPETPVMWRAGPRHRNTPRHLTSARLLHRPIRRLPSDAAQRFK